MTTHRKKKKKTQGKKMPSPSVQRALEANDRGLHNEMMNLAETCIFFGGRSSPIDRSTFYRGVRNGLFPKPVKIGQRIARWRLSDCQAALKRMQTGAQP